MPLIDLNGLGYFKGKENAMVAGNYSASNTYAVGDYVYYSGTLYRCTTAITTAEAWTAAHWTAAKLAEDLTSQSEKIAEVEAEVENFDFSKVTAQNIYINDADVQLKWKSGGNVSFTYFIPVYYGQVVTLLTTYRWGSYYAFLTKSVYEAGTVPYYCENHTAIYTMAKDVPQTVTVPMDCKFIAIRIDNKNISAFSATIKTTLWDYAKEISRSGAMPLNIQYRALMASFNDGERNLRIFATKNLQYFEQIGVPFKPTKGNEACRDPYVYIYNGAYYVFYTDAKNFQDANNTIGVAKTYDFITYEEFDPIVCNNNFVICWAPSIFEENGNYYLTVSASTTDYSSPSCYIYDLDIDNMTVSNEQLITITDVANPLDIHFYKFNGYYYAIGKNEYNARSMFAKSATLKGTYTLLDSARFSGQPEEGQMIVRLDNGEYRLYLNDFSVNQKLYYVDIPDIDSPTQNTGALTEVISNSPVPLYHPSIHDFNRPYCFES